MSYIEVIDVNKTINKIQLINNVSLSINKGEAIGLVGNNGSGKTVLMKLISGLFSPSSGNIIIDGKRLGKDITFPESMGLMIETPGFIAAYSGYRNLKLLADIKRKIYKADVRMAMRTVGLDPDERKHVSKYSLGMRQRLAIAQAIMEDPQLLILDEPFNGLDRNGIEEMRKLMCSLKKSGKTILLSSHSKEDIKVICDRVYTMEDGRIFHSPR